MLKDHCHRVSTHLQSINIIIIIKFRPLGITQKKAYNIQDTAKV